MDYPQTPGPKETLEDLAWLHPEIYRGIDYGVFEARIHFETTRVDYDGAAFSTLVRLHAKNYYRRKGYDAVDIEEVSLTGLSLKLEGYHIKIWKAHDSSLPAPGSSEPKQAYYQQTLNFDGGERPEIIRLAVIWNVNASRALSAMWLVCPKDGDETSAEAYWTERIPDPSLEIPQFNPEPIGPDLPMGPKESEDDKKKKGNERQ